MVRHLVQPWLMVVVICLTPATLLADDAPPAGSDWLHAGGDAGGSRYSPLDQINRHNVWRLEQAWTWRHGDLERFPEQRKLAGFHTTPILLPPDAGGALVLCTPFNRLVALDPASGKERWSFDPKIQLRQITGAAGLPGCQLLARYKSRSCRSMQPADFCRYQ